MSRVSKVAASLLGIVGAVWALEIARYVASPGVRLAASELALFGIPLTLVAIAASWYQSGNAGTAARTMPFRSRYAILVGASAVFLLCYAAFCCAQALEPSGSAIRRISWVLFALVLAWIAYSTYRPHRGMLIATSALIVITIGSIGYNAWLYSRYPLPQAVISLFATMNFAAPLLFALEIARRVAKHAPRGSFDEAAR